MHKLQLNSFKVELANMPAYFQNLRMSCYFILSKNLIPRMAFISDKQDSTRTIQYLNIVKTIL